MRLMSPSSAAEEDEICCTSERSEGYLFSFGASRGGSIYCVPTFCILSGRRFAQLRHKGDSVTLRSGILDENHQVEDTGRQLVNGKVLYTIRLYSTVDHAKEVLLGATSAEEAAGWMRGFVMALGKQSASIWEPWPATESRSIPEEELGRSTRQPAKMLKSSRVASVDSLPPLSSAMPRWRLVRCDNGLRYFEELQTEAKIPVLKSVGVIKGQADHIFDEIMNYGPERFQWDHTIETASIADIVDGHSDVLHICLRRNSRWLKPRDLCISRYWKREDNGSYTIFYRSVLRQPAEAGHVRAQLHSGGYIITPISTSGKPKSLVESVFEIEAGGWASSSYSLSLRDSLLSVIAGIREYFAAQRIDAIVKHALEAGSFSTSCITATPFLEAEVEEDYFYACAEQLSESEGSVASPCKREARIEECSKLNGSLPRGPSTNARNSYSEPETNTFKIRGNDGVLIPAAESPFFRLVAVDWYKSKGRLDYLSRRTHIVQSAPSEDTFFFTFNLQVPHSGSYYSLAFYFSTKRKIKEGSLVYKFINGTDEFRSQHLVLLPSIPEGSWIVRQAVGSRAVVLGHILQCCYDKGSNYIEVDIDMGSSAIVRGVMGIVFGYMSALVVDMGFLLRAESEDELPEELLGVVRCSRLDLSSAVEPSI